MSYFLILIKTGNSEKSLTKLTLYIFNFECLLLFQLLFIVVSNTDLCRVPTSNTCSNFLSYSPGLQNNSNSTEFSLSFKDEESFQPTLHRKTKLQNTESEVYISAAQGKPFSSAAHYLLMLQVIDISLATALSCSILKGLIQFLLMLADVIF